MSIPADLKYTESHEWVRTEADGTLDRRHHRITRRKRWATSCSSNCRQSARPSPPATTPPWSNR